jgi:hypothetical protein
MLKQVAIAMIVLVGCKGGDKCERMVDKLASGLAKDLGHAPDKAKMVGECREGLQKHPASEKMIDCVLAISGEPSKEDMQKCMDPDDRRTPAAAKQLKRLAETAKTAFAKTGAFPQGKVALSPAKECCFGNPDAKQGKCPVDAAAWQDPTWKALDFSIDEPSLYRYSYESDGKTFTALAVGDADCDTNLATFTLTGAIEGGVPKVDLVSPPKGAY